MTTTFSLNQNGWKIDPSFGSTSASELSYIRAGSGTVPANASFPAVQANSPYLVDSKGFAHVIFGTYSESTWTWLVPTISGSTFTFNITESTTIVYPFVFIDRVAYCIFALTKFDGTGGANAVDVTTLCVGTYQFLRINWQTDMQNTLLPSNGFPILINARAAEAIIDISRYMFDTNNNIGELSMNIGRTFDAIVAPAAEKACTIYVFESSFSPIYPVTLLATQRATTYTIASDDKAAYTLNNYIGVNNNDSMTVNNGSGTNTLTINDYAAQPSGFQAPTGTNLTYTPQTQTHFLLRQNGWKQAVFDGSGLSYAGTTQVKAVAKGTFPNNTSAESSHWLTSVAHSGFAVIFGTYDSSGSTWTWLTPTIMDDLFMFTVNASAADDTTVVYPFVVSRANDGEAVKVSCVQYYNGIHAANGKNTSAHLFVGTAQLTAAIVWKIRDTNTFLPADNQYVHIAYDGTTTSAIINITDYYESVPDNNITITITLSNINIRSINSQNYFTICVLLNESLQPTIIENIPIVVGYTFTTTDDSTITINNHVSFGANSFIQLIGNIVFNDYAMQPIGFAPTVEDDGAYNSYPQSVYTGPVQQIAHLQSVQRNLQTIFDRINTGLVDDESQHYVATGQFSDAVWEQFRSLASEVIGEGGGGSSSGLTEIKEYSVTVPNEADPANITVAAGDNDYVLYVAHGGTYYAVQGSSAGITVAGLSDGPDWSTSTGGVITFTTVGSSTKLFFNGVMQSIVTDWTTNELEDVSGKLGEKTVAWVGDAAVPFITFKSVQPSFILVPSS